MIFSALVYFQIKQKARRYGYANRKILMKKPPTNVK